MARKNKNRKKQDQLHHAQGRFATRWNITLTPQLHNHFVHKIIMNSNQAAKLLYKETNRLSIYLIEYDGKKMPVVFDKQRQQIVTALPEGAYQ